MNIFVLLTMLFLHVVDDFYLQGCLANMKQKEWWKNTEYIYRADYIMALVIHAFSWTFMIMLPIMVYMVYVKKIYYGMYCVYFLVNWFFHAHIDNLKANKKRINLIADQILHVIQILVTYFFFVAIFGF